MASSGESPRRTLVHFKGVTKSFGPRPIIHRLDWSLVEGDCAVILGPSGGGKSVFLSLLLGFIEPDEGSIAFDPGLEADIFRRVAVVFQDDALFDDRSVAANLAIALLERADILGETRDPAVRGKITAVLRDVGLDPARVSGLLPSELSGGMRRRVAIARAILRCPEILIADEPTSGLDPETSASIFGLIAGLRRSHGISMVIITHDPVCAATLGDPVYAFTPLAGQMARLEQDSHDGSPLDSVAGRILAWTRGAQESDRGALRVPPERSLLRRGPADRIRAALEESLDALGRSVLALGVLGCRPSPALLLDGSRRWGLGSLPLVLLIFALLGAVLLIQAERAVTDVGFSNRLPELLVMGLTRLAPIITGFLVAGRCGSAVTAQTGWMRLSNQDKALRSMRMDADAAFFPPLFWTFLVWTPLLALCGLAAGWGSAWIILDFQLSSAQITARYFASQIWESVGLGTAAAVVAKSALIGAGIAMIAYGCGGPPKRSALQVTTAITRGLVLSFIWITVVDAVITLLVPA